MQRLNLMMAMRDEDNEAGLSVALEAMCDEMEHLRDLNQLLFFAAMERRWCSEAPS